jgi:hypothetical protein
MPNFLRRVRPTQVLGAGQLGDAGLCQQTGPFRPQFIPFRRKVTFEVRTATLYGFILSFDQN